VACTLALSRLILTLTLNFLSLNVTVAAFERRLGWALSLNWGLGSANDVIIAVTLVWWLSRQRVDVTPRTDTLVHKIIKWTIQTGVLLSATTTVTLICFVTMRRNFVWMSVYVVQARLYSNSFLSSLNSRATLQAIEDITIPFPSNLVNATERESKGVHPGE